MKIVLLVLLLTFVFGILGFPTSSANSTKPSKTQGSCHAALNRRALIICGSSCQENDLLGLLCNKEKIDEKLLKEICCPTTSDASNDGPASGFLIFDHGEEIKLH
ncbi:hypothetical protein L5515_002410 [Caenorhabditis briggsae]|uniref:Uncharacterized protein n=1 Tax=Caenorhabditis briggsae TaxID=6238 RepID=A0AAE9E412_CAEBR|nr:hypothetical protein L5515_002410 [Caenorhabditis briggsae]